jgi:putative oxidoreductase
MIEVDLAALLLRATVGGTVIAHGWNHVFGGGRLPGTARWFESIGIRPGRLHAVFATVTERGAGVLLSQSHPWIRSRFLFHKALS